MKKKTIVSLSFTRFIYFFMLISRKFDYSKLSCRWLLCYLFLVFVLPENLNDFDVIAVTSVRKKNIPLSYFNDTNKVIKTKIVQNKTGSPE